MGMFYGLNWNSTVVPINLGYGYLYNWYAASNANFAPTDWRVPLYDDFIDLAIYLLPSNRAGKLKEEGFDHWNSPNTGGDDTYGFSAYGGGDRQTSFVSLKNEGLWWSSDVSKCLLLRHDSGELEVPNIQAYWGCSIKLIYEGTGSPTSVTDIDGNIYDVELIGTQYWTKQNWKCTRLNNGISIPNVTDNTEWSNLGSGTGIDSLYGLLYNWYTIDGNSGNLVDGLHVPSDTEWTTLTTYLGGESVAGGKLKEVGNEHWTTYNIGTILDEYKFTALPGGYRLYSDGTFNSVGNVGLWWSSTANSSSFAYVRSMSYKNNTVSSNDDDKSYGFSVRCMRTLTTLELLLNDGDVIETVTDYDGNSYGLIKIGTQGWMNANLKTTKYTNGNSIPTGFTGTQWAALTAAGYCIYDDSTLDNPNGLCAYDNDPGNV